VREDGVRDGILTAGDELTPPMLMLDPPEHTRVRLAVSQALAHHGVETLRTGIESITHELLDRAEAKGGMDVVADFANLLPAIVILELLGLPKDDYGQLKAWHDALAGGVGYAGVDELRVAHQALAGIRTYLHKASDVEAGSRPGLLKTLAACSKDENGLTQDEVHANSVFLIGAGFVSTAASLANAVQALLAHRDQWELLRSDLSLMASAVEELLRYEGSNEATARFPLEDIEIGGKTIRAGEQVTVLFAAANRDPERFPNPDQLDITGGTTGTSPSDRGYTTASAYHWRGSRCRRP
jgi:cytochrome P450